MQLTGALLTSAEESARPATPPVEVWKTLDLPERKQLELLAFAIGSTRIDGHCIGWLPAAAYVGAHNQGRMVACYNNDDLVGYILWGANNGIIRCFIVWVRRDARLLLHGRALVDAIKQEGARRGCCRVELWCAVDLAANLFWQALGFTQVCWRWGRAKRGRRHWLWRLPITPHDQPRAATVPELRA
jgi:GNAT superfamily N-acetyltransferase